MLFSDVFELMSFLFVFFLIVTVGISPGISNSSHDYFLFSGVFIPRLGNGNAMEM